MYTHPDRFSPELKSLNGQYRLDLGSGFSLAATAYGRLLDINQFNHDVEEDGLAHTNQDGWGSSVQLTYQDQLRGMPLTAIAGLDYTGATLRHLIAEREFGDDNDDEGVATQRRAQEESEQSGFEPRADVTTDMHGGGAFLTVTLEPTERLSVTASGRFDITDLKIKDRLAATGEEDRTTDASGSHRFDRFNPAIGTTYSLLSNLSLYANYSESYCAPTAIELTGANPEAPCPIPTAIVDDSPLDPVKGKNWETGLRWAPLPQIHATLAFFVSI